MFGFWLDFHWKWVFKFFPFWSFVTLFLLLLLFILNLHFLFFFFSIFINNFFLILFAVRFFLFHLKLFLFFLLFSLLIFLLTNPFFLRFLFFLLLLRLFRSDDLSTKNAQPHIIGTKGWSSLCQMKRHVLSSIILIIQPSVNFKFIQATIEWKICVDGQKMNLPF